ncbi:MAG TPA: class I SAM-dependent methyltransferase [Candidatus Didemnitutus sp.]|nr:class I SAM-dependent methyltransferase [Candidatus Didemnitutus sp.]
MRDPEDMTMFVFRSLDEYQEHWRRMAPRFAERVAAAEALCAPWRDRREGFTVEAESYPAGRKADLAVEWLSSTGSQPAWREYLICPLTGLNARMRASVHVIDAQLGLRAGDAVYLTEQTTPLYQFLRAKFSRLIGSEYLEPSLAPGWIDAHGVRHEDLIRTSFSAEKFDAVLTFECLEHIPDYRAALRECRRILKSGGKLLFSVPFAASQQEHVIRARLRPDGSIEHLLEPEYHGDPRQQAGCLCFTHFGWEMINDLGAAGFNDPQVVTFWSREFGYLGDETAFFLATAP